MFSYASRVQSDIRRWLDAGLIDAGTARALSSDIRLNARQGFSLGSVLTIMAATLFAAAILIFIAANWEAIPRLARVAMLFSLIAGGYLGGALLHLRGHSSSGDAAWIIAAAAFGASIALIGQMYHLSGDEKQAIFIWAAATTFAAAALRSPPLTVGASMLAAAWMFSYPIERWSPYDLPLAYPIVVAVLYIVSFWTDSRASRHILILSLFVYVFVYHWRDEAFVIPTLLVVLSVGLFAFGRMAPDLSARFLGLGSSVTVHALLGFLTGIGIIQMELIDEPGFMLATIVALAGIVAALLAGGRDSVPLRRLAYTAFAFQLAFIYIRMFDTMLGTAGFFLVAGITLAVLALAITRLEKRFSPDAANGEAS